MKKYFPFLVTAITVLSYVKAFAGNVVEPPNLPNTVAVPEPISATLFLMGAGALGMKLFRKK
jgi:hypothetical protein